jgi:ribonuclease HII
MTYYGDIKMLICGVDEAGRGPLAGPVVAAAVILDPLQPIQDLDDSKKLTSIKRNALAAEIKHKAKAWTIARADVDEIDKLNILRASLLAMQRCIKELLIKPTLVMVDGPYCPQIDLPVKAVIKGDRKIPAISAASILAKVDRDMEMSMLDKQYPGYGFSSHKGYPTRSHISALRKLGVSPIHRKSFAPVRNML